MNPLPTCQDIAQQQHDCTFMPNKSLTLEQQLRFDVYKASELTPHCLSKEGASYAQAINDTVQFILTGEAVRASD